MKRNLQLKKKTGIVMFFLALLTFVFFVYSLSLGPGDLSFRQIFAVIHDKWSMQEPKDLSLHNLLWQLRIPRALLALLTGAALGCAGAITQGIFRNPLAAPSLLGMNSGAACVVVLGMTLGIDEIALWATPLLSAVGVLFSVFLLYLFARGIASILPLLLSGLALSTFFSALMTLLHSIYLFDYGVTMKVMQWLLGSLDAKSWEHFKWGLAPIGLGLLGAFYLRRGLDLLHLGEESASSLGLHLPWVYCLGIVSTALLVGTTTSLVGIIGFLGLVVPHSVRLVFGSSYLQIIPLSMCVGALLMLFVDTLSRVLVQFHLSPGVITSLAGAPLFLWLIRNHYRRGMGTIDHSHLKNNG